MDNENKKSFKTVDALKEQIGKALCESDGASVKDITIRTGEAQELPNIIPTPVKIKGGIGAPERWVAKRAGTFDEKKAYVVANYDNRTINLQLDELNPYGSEIIGTLQLDPDFVRFGINNGQYVSNFDLADFIKMNRAFFADPMQAMKLVTQLRQFQAKVENDIANSDDKRGNARLLKAQTVEHNLPEHFTLNIPIFRNTEPQTIDVEVDVKSTDLTMTLVSPEAADIVHKSTKDIIQDELKKIGETCPDLVIIEQ